MGIYSNDSILASGVSIEESVAAPQVKNFSDTYIYNMGNYETKLIEFIMHSKYLDKKNPGYIELINDIKRQRVSSSLPKMLESDNCILCVNEVPMPRAFKVFVAKDIKGTNKNDLKLYIDVTGLIKIDGLNYEYRMQDLSIIISYLLAGMSYMIYYKRPEKIINNTNLLSVAIGCYSRLFYYILDYLRLSGDAGAKGKVSYLINKYFLINLLQKEEGSEFVENWALKVSGISENESTVANYKIEDKTNLNPYLNIKTFCTALSKYFNNPKFTTDVMVDKWMYSFGNGSQFGLELFPAFSQMLIYAYVGAYLNNQKTMEKILGRDLVTFVTRIIEIGAELI